MMFKSFLPKVRAENREQGTGCRCVVCVGVWVYVASLPTVCILTCNIFFQPVPFYLLPSSFFRLPSTFYLLPSPSFLPPPQDRRHPRRRDPLRAARFVRPHCPHRRRHSVPAAVWPLHQSRRYHRTRPRFRRGLRPQLPPCYGHRPPGGVQVNRFMELCICVFVYLYICAVCGHPTASSYSFIYSLSNLA